MPFIYSTLSADTIYAFYNENKSRDIPVADHSVLVKGGANIANKQIVTPKGVVTEVSDEDLRLLMNDYHFKEHMANGFILVDAKEANPDKVAKNNMIEKDLSAPKTPDDAEFLGTARVDLDDKKKGKK